MAQAVVLAATVKVVKRPAVEATLVFPELGVALETAHLIVLGSPLPPDSAKLNDESPPPPPLHDEIKTDKLAINASLKNFILRSRVAKLPTFIRESIGRNDFFL